MSKVNNVGNAVALCAALSVCIATARADDYTLAAGQSDAVSDGETHSYGTISVSGDLTVGGNAKFWASTSVSLQGGSVTIDGSNSSFGSQSNNDGNSKPVALGPGGDGKYTKVVVRNGKTSAVSGNYYNFSGKTLTIAAATAAAVEQYHDGCFDFLDVDGASASFFSIENKSSLTGRVSVAGTSRLGKHNGYSYGAGFFLGGNFLVDVASGAVCQFTAGQHGSFNAAGCGVHVTGDGNLLFLQSYSTGQPYKCSLRKGAVLDVTGTITFSDAGSRGWFYLADDNVFGPAAGKVSTALVSGGYNNGVILEVASNVVVTVHDLEVKRTADAVAGSGTIRIDATAAARSFEANIPATYGIGATIANNITIAKFGDYEATIAATNFPTLKVESGVVRLTRDCVVGALAGASGAKVIADGCVVSIMDGESFSGGLELEAANGGAFAKIGSGRTLVHSPGAIGVPVHVASGELVFSDTGLKQKYWRWTFTKTKTSPNPLWLGRLWLFGSDGSHVASGLTYSSKGDLSNEKRICYFYDSETNLTAEAGVPWYQAASALNKVTESDLANDMNHFPKLATPVIDSANESSWLGVGLRLAASDKPVTGYNMMSEDSDHYPVSWEVEASHDGVAWTNVETRTDVVHAHPGTYYFYDGEKYNEANARRGSPVEHFRFSGYKSDGLAADPAKAVSLQVDGGASVDLTAFTEAPQKIGCITVDFAAGGGTIHGGSIASGGTLYIVNSSQGFARDSALPIVLDGVVDGANFSSWSVCIDGKPASGRRVELNGNGELVVSGMGAVIIVF